VEEFNLNDFLNAICLKNQLITVTTDKLLEVYSDYENFITFLDSFYVLSSMDSGFMLLSDDFIKKVMDVIGDNRFKYDDSEITETINSYISYLNSIKCYSESYRNLLKNGYLSYNEDARKIEFDSDEGFIDALAFDAVVYASLESENFSERGEDALILSSLNYFIECCPGLFMNEGYKKQVDAKLRELSRRGWPFNRSNREYALETQEALGKIYKK